MTSIKVSAVPSAPVCDACGGETASEDGDWVCQDCDIYWDPEDLSTAHYLDDTTPACGKPYPGTHYADDGRWTLTNHPCDLPATHTSRFHHHPCTVAPTRRSP